MMKVLKDNYTKATVEEVKKVEPYPRRLVCEECRSELEYVESDLRMGALGCMYLDCRIQMLCGSLEMYVM